MIVIGPGSIKEYDSAGKLVSSSPAEPTNAENLAIIQSDIDFWKAVSTICGLELKEIPAQYTDKSPVTPWYQATLPTGDILILGSRWRVDAIRAIAHREYPATYWNKFIEWNSKLYWGDLQTFNGGWIGGSSGVTTSGTTLEVHTQKSDPGNLINIILAWKQLFPRFKRDIEREEGKDS